MKKIYFGLLLCLSILGGVTTASANSNQINEIDPNEVSSSRLDVGLEENGVSTGTRAAVTTFNNKPQIHWRNGYRAVSSWTQAKQGSKNISSYSRARFEYPWYMGGGVYNDTGRKNSPKFGEPSYAKSPEEYYRNGQSGMAATYYGV